MLALTPHFSDAEGSIDAKASNAALASQALAFAKVSLPYPCAENYFVFSKAGADIVAPSDMMDGRILAIKQVHNPHLHPHLHSDFPPRTGASRQWLRQQGLGPQLRRQVLLQLLRTVP